MNAIVRSLLLPPQRISSHPLRVISHYHDTLIFWIGNPIELVADEVRYPRTFSSSLCQPCVPVSFSQSHFLASFIMCLTVSFAPSYFDVVRYCCHILRFYSVSRVCPPHPAAPIYCLRLYQIHLRAWSWVTQSELCVFVCSLSASILPAQIWLNDAPVRFAVVQFLLAEVLSRVNPPALSFLWTFRAQGLAVRFSCVHCAPQWAAVRRIRDPLGAQTGWCGPQCPCSSLVTEEEG